jgi:hypothetical protein
VGEEEEEREVKCPHCLTEYHGAPTNNEIFWERRQLTETDGTRWSVNSEICPACGRAIIHLRSFSPREALEMLADGTIDVLSEQEYLAWPRGVARTPLSADVPEYFAKDCRESGNILADSPRASAAISRYSLQRLLREKAGVKPGNLSDEIDEVLESKTLPSDLAEDLDTIRVIGNFGTHPIKSKNTGEIVDVETGEAEHTLTVLEELLDFYYVRPAARAAKRAEINKKQTDAGKPPLKAPPK